MNPNKVRCDKYMLIIKKINYQLPFKIVQKILNIGREATLFRIIPVECWNQENRSRYGRNLRLTV
jgi:hypothetical protein